jgi:hypothetical protein
MEQVSVGGCGCLCVHAFPPLHLHPEQMTSARDGDKRQGDAETAIHIISSLLSLRPKLDDNNVEGVRTHSGP